MTYSSIQEFKHSFNPEELALLRSFVRFEEVVYEAAKSFSPNLICSYLFDLAQKYNLFYAKHSILGIQKSESRIQRNATNKLITDNRPASPAGGQLTTEFRLALTQATANV